MGHETNITQAALAAGLFDQSQAQQLEALLPTLRPEQALWLSGYLAGLGAQTQPAQAAGGQGGGEAPQITVLYGTETGNAEGVAKQLAERATQKGLKARAVDMAEYKTKDLKSETHVVLVSATHGEGDPPDPAAPFFEFLWSRKAPKLKGTKFAVFSLGDSSYVNFCQAGKDLDARFEELGGERLAERVDTDVDYEDDAEAWVEKLVGLLESEAAPAGQPASPGAPAALQGVLGGLPGAAPAADKPKHSRKNPYQAEILDAVVLNGRHSTKETRHIELSLEDSGLTFEPGDSLGIVPENEDATVERVVDSLGLTPGDTVHVNGAEKSLGDALKRDLELTMLTPGFLQAYADAAESEELRALLAEDNREALHTFMGANQVADVLARYPVSGLDAATFTGMLRKLQPRLYSIASSQAALPDEVHLTVGVTRYTSDGKPRNGVASTYLAERREPGETVPVYVDHNKAFKLPSDPTTPLIMIGPGTGVAPFRAFLQEREEMGATGKNWLFFGERTFREDFLYQTDWQQFRKDGLLTRMDVAFSRDQKEKVYVQDRVRQRSRDVYAWLQEGANLYVCGDADAMAPAVHEALTDVVKDEGGLSREDAQAYLKQLQQERRYQRDVY
ncbi:sulfite reductase (NADPH) alpha subunit [Limimonas halophila]|uniref:Sulfite reductase [NADPH] flavoprotein alpha-component n=1 Tax=Limimonas halophila TaxID=1082479 RepID=A0A1G7Q4E7_9PROT|nr:assimilatory sulfite reductase (NADPH) flavoprotein subunit [Limimonas halophila]SDF93371.1 sulfite reductase (NADPH) alpha subunit [Limimonas halophila]